MQGSAPKRPELEKGCFMSHGQDIEVAAVGHNGHQTI
jgi:hypothetical protein